MITNTTNIAIIKFAFKNAISINKALLITLPMNNAVSWVKKYSTLYSLFIISAFEKLTIFLSLIKSDSNFETVWNKLYKTTVKKLQFSNITHNNTIVIGYVVHNSFM